MDPKSMYPTSPRVSFGRAITIGLGAGTVGALSMVFTSKLEQFLFTSRPNSYVPARTIATHLGLHDFGKQHPDILNHAHHFGMALLTAPVRAIMAYYGIIGPMSSYIFSFIRVAADQVVEIGAGASAAPWSWPFNEQVIDILHKGVFSFLVGYICDKYVRGVDWFN